MRAFNETGEPKKTFVQHYSEASITASTAAADRDAALAAWTRERETLEAEAEAVRVVAAAEMTAAKAR